MTALALLFLLAMPARDTLPAPDARLAALARRVDSLDPLVRAARRAGRPGGAAVPEATALDRTFFAANLALNRAVLARIAGRVAAAAREAELPASGLAVVGLDGVPRDTLARRQALAERWLVDRAAPGAPAIVLVVGHLGDAAGRRRRMLPYLVLPPGPRTGGRCVVALEARGGASAAAAARACALVRRFGMPGDAVRRWLDATGWLAAAARTPGVSLLGNRWGPDWRVAASDLVTGLRTSSYTEPSGRVLRRALGPAYWEGPAAARCAGGDPDACERWLLAPRASIAALPDQPMLAPGGGSIAPPWEWSRQEASTPDGITEYMLDAFGEQRFARFWRSDAPVSEAFQAATGRPLGAWLAEVVAEELAPEQGAVLAAIRRPGPTLGPGQALAALGWIALGVLLALLAAGWAWPAAR